MKKATILVVTVLALAAMACDKSIPNYNRCDHMQCGPVDAGPDGGCDDVDVESDGGVVNG